MKKMLRIKPCVKKNLKAFSLVEVLCAIVLLAIVATPILQAIYSGLSLNLRSRKMLAAADITSGAMEFVSSLVFDDYNNLGKDIAGNSVDVMGLESFYWGGPSSAKNVNKCYLHNKGINPVDGTACGLLFPNGPTCDYVNVSGNDNQRTILVQNVLMDGFKFDIQMVTKSELPGGGDADNDYYCYNVEVEVREHSEGALFADEKVLSYASTKIANKYE